MRLSCSFIRHQIEERYAQRDVHHGNRLSATISFGLIDRARASRITRPPLIDVVLIHELIEAQVRISASQLGSRFILVLAAVP